MLSRPGRCCRDRADAGLARGGSAACAPPPIGAIPRGLSVRLVQTSRERSAMRFQLAAIVLAAAVNAQDAACPPARYASGNLPPSHPLAVAGGEVFLQVGVAADGHVTSASVLRTTPPFTEEMASAVRGWQFEPAKLGST